MNPSPPIKRHEVFLIIALLFFNLANAHHYSMTGFLLSLAGGIYLLASFVSVFLNLKD